MLMLWLPILILFLTSAQSDENDTKLLLVQILFRHADRTPIRLYPTDPNPEEAWPEGLETITMLGKRQAYGLGKFFREMYGDFITTSPNEVTVNSSNADRCVRTALTTIASFYEPSPQWAFDDSINWQPIPVHSVDVMQDKYLSGRMPCERSKKEMKKVLDEQFQILLRDHKEMIDNLTLHSGQRNDDVISLTYLQDTLEIERRDELIIPPWADYYFDELKTAVGTALNWLSQSLVVRRLVIGPLLGKIVEDMNKKSAGEIPDIKVRLYSSHDFHVSNMLEALNVSNKLRPPYCASVIFELHETRDGAKVVRLLYLNSTRPEDVQQEPHKLILDGCSEFCPLDYFASVAEEFIPVNWEEECKITNNSSAEVL